MVTYDADWQNNRQKAKVIVAKKEKDSDRVLEGGVFALCAKNDIKNAEGEVIVKADTVIEQKATDKDGKIIFTADLPIGGNLLCEGSEGSCRICDNRRNKGIYF